jgi:sugar phosphate isomerase/epimerase
MPGEGKVDWQALLHDLLAVGYRGPWLYEVSYRCPKTITRPRDLTPEDIVKNAREIFENKPLTRV